MRCWRRGLATGVAILCLAQPAVPPRTGPAGRRLVVLLDRSFSLEHPQAWQAARERADALFSTLGPEDIAALISFDVEPRVEAAFTSGSDLLKTALWSGLAPRGLGTEPEAGLAEAVRLLAGEGASGEVHLVSDFQESAYAGFRPRLPAGVGFEVHPVRLPAGPNVAAVSVYAQGGDRLGLRLSYRDGALEDLLLPAGSGRLEGVLRVPPAGRRPGIRVTTANLAGGRIGVVVEALSGDGWPADDRRFWVDSGAAEAVAGRPLPPGTWVSGARDRPPGPPGRRWLPWPYARQAAPDPLLDPGLHRLELAEGRGGYLVVGPEPRESRLEMLGLEAIESMHRGRRTRPEARGPRTAQVSPFIDLAAAAPLELRSRVQAGL